MAVLDRRKLDITGRREPLDEAVKVAAAGEVASTELRMPLGTASSRTCLLSFPTASTGST
jgi:hypothetical protein